MLGSDSHSTTYGAVAAFGSGMGTTDIALAAASGKTWLKVPESVKVTFTGDLRSGVTAKDVALEMIRRLGADGATYQSIEMHAGDRFTRGERMTLANLCVEAGAKAGLVVPGGEILTAYGYDIPEWVYPDEGATYVQSIEIDLSTLNPRMSAPSEVDNVFDVAQLREELRDQHVDQVFIGTCTNGRIDDMRAAAAVLKGRKAVVPAAVSPGSTSVKRQAEAEGLDRIFQDAGFEWRGSGCSSCTAQNGDAVPPGERCVSTSNRNFEGRQGKNALTHLASPAMAADRKSTRLNSSHRT